MNGTRSHTFHVSSIVTTNMLGKDICSRKYAMMGAGAESRVNVVMVKPYLTWPITQKAVMRVNL